MPSALRYAARRLYRDKALTGVALGILGLGIGAVTALFTVVNAALLSPLPYPHADRLAAVRLFEPSGQRRDASFPVNAAHVAAWARQCRTCDAVGAIGSFRATMSGRGASEQVDGLEMTPSLLAMLGLSPALGRPLVAADAAPGAPRVALLGHALFARRFGADPSVVGQTLDINGQPVTIIGVLGRRLPIPGPGQLGDLVRLPADPEIVRPLVFSPDMLQSPGDLDYGVVVRLAPDTSPAALAATLDALEPAIAAQTEDPGHKRTIVQPLQAVVTERARGPLLVLFTATMAVLLIVCVNLANILLARQAGGRRDAAIRTALGAGRSGLVRDTLIESALLGVTGGAAGLAIAAGLIRGILAVAPPALPTLTAIAIDWRVLAFCALVSIGAGLCIGLLPALRMAQIDPGDTLKASSYGSTEHGRAGRTRRLLVAAQAALGVALLIVTGLLLASFVRLMHVDKGFDTADVLGVDVALPPAVYPTSSEQLRALAVIQAQLSSLPGARSVAIASRLPLRGQAVVNLLSYEHDTRQPSERPLANYRYVTPNYFSTIGTPILRGRTFLDTDRGHAVVILSASAAQALWPGQDAVGRVVQTGGFLGAPSSVVGVAADSRAVDLTRNDVNFTYLPYWLNPQANASFVIRTQMAPAAFAPAVRRAITGAERGAAVPRVETMDGIVGDAIADRRFELGLMLLFGGAAALLAALGVYGVVSYSVARRGREMGIRMALGARAADLQRLVFTEALAPVGGGLVVGITASFAAGRALAGLLFDVRPDDPVVAAAATLTLLIAALAACMGPARRAARSTCRLAD